MVSFLSMCSPKCREKKGKEGFCCQLDNLVKFKEGNVCFCFDKVYQRSM